MPNRRGLLFIALALVVGSLAAFLALSGRRQAAGTAPAAGETVPVVVARTDLAVSATIDALQLGVVAWPKQFLPPATHSDPKSVAGRVTRRPLVTGEPVLESALLPAGSGGGLGALIAPSHRAVSVKVDNVIGVAGFVKPGTRVDVLATLRRVDRDKALPYSKVILQDVKVLAVDQQLEQANQADAAIVSVATLEVDPTQAERLIYAAHEGRLQLALRSPGDAQTVATRSVGVAEVLAEATIPAKPATQGSIAAPRRSSVQVLLGSKLENRSF